ncbi:hypothetical protein Tco_1135687 [Tanacetum coccineum]
MSLLLRGTLSLMMNLDDTDDFRDHFLNDNPTKDDQANTLAPLLSTTTTLALPPPPLTQSSTDPELVARVVALERRNAKLEHAFMIQHNTTKNLASRIFTLEHHDIQAKIDNYVHEIVKENVEECHKLLTNKVDLVNPEGHRIMPDISKPLPIGGPPEINAFIRPLEREAREYGDYLCFNVLKICDELRKKNPDLFDEIKPKDIAMEISRELKLENTDKISRHSIQLHDIGVISFMLQRSGNEDVLRGIYTCVTSNYMKAKQKVFDILDEGISPSTNISSELETIKKYERFYNADIIVYITPDLQQEPHCNLCLLREFQAAVASCGYRCFNRNPEEELYGLWQHYLSRYLSVSELAEDAGYSREGFFVCALKFSFLKRHRLAECGFDIDEILNEEGEEIMSSILSSSVEHGPCRELAEARCKYLNSRFEIFSMNVDVADLTLDEYDIFGTVSVIDTFGARADGWTMSDENDRCFVTYFKREWHNPLGTFNGSCIPLGDPSCRRSVPVSSSVDVRVLVQVSSKNRDRYYKICYVPHVESFSDFWAGQGKAKSGTLQFKSKAGLVGLNYILLKEAVDASIELTFSSPSVVSLQVCGQIIAYYGDSLVKDDGGILGQLKAVLFRTGKSELNGNQVPLELHKSVVAVPVDGCLMIEAFLMDVKTNKVIVDDMIEYRAKPGNADNWSIKCKGYSFNLKVAWSELTSA